MNPIRSCVLIGGVLLAGALGGCLGSGPKDPRPAFTGPLPTPAQLAERYNAHIRGLEQLRAPVSLVIDAPDGKGGTRHDQVEANLQVVPPLRVSLRIDKVSQTLAILGSNEERYWWFDLSGDKVGYVGRHDLATVRSAEDFGVPVLPADLVQLLAITPLPSEGVAVELHPNRSWLIATLPGAPKRGRTRLTIDTTTYHALRVEVLGPAGEALATAALSRYIQVEVAGDVLSPARIASRYDIQLPSMDATVTISLSSPENPGKKMKQGGFDYDAVRAAYGVDDVRDLDARERP